MSPAINRACCCISRFRNVLVDALVRSQPIEIPHVLVEDTTQVCFAEDQHMVEAFTPNVPQQSLADGIRVGCPDRHVQHLDPAPRRHRVVAGSLKS